ncbi:MAG TPA: cytochrome P450 [Kofleriaceae bacterium]|nr:cytochrome P450 [Kofleriaceae bacterium]
MVAVPSPREAPLVQRLRYLRDPIGYMARCQRELGDIFMLKLLDPGMVLVASPELAREVYTADETKLVAGEAKIAVFGKILGSSSTLLLDGEAHLERRRLLLPPFRGELVQRLAPAMTEACTRTLATLPLDRDVALHPYLHRIAFDVIARSLFSTTPVARRTALEAAMHEFARRAVTSRLLMFPKLQIDLGPLSPWGKVVRVVARARAALLDEIRRRRADAGGGEDILSLLVTARGDDGAGLNDSEIVDEMLTMVAAGHETTAMALTWLAYAVYTRPSVLASLRDEARAGLPLAERPYLQAVIRESLRYYSVIPNGSGRIAKRAFELGGYEVPARAMVSVAFHAVHRRLDVFADADVFRPERFIGAKLSPYEWIPFGGGTRRCLGMPSALFELQLVLSEVTAGYDVRVVQKVVKPMWRGRFLTPNKGLIVRVTPVARA